MGCGASTGKSSEEFEWEKEAAESQSAPEPKPPPAHLMKRKRASVSAECFTPGMQTAANPVHPKSDEEKVSIERKLKLNVLFKILDEEQMKVIVDAVEKKEFTEGTDIIVKGDLVADYFYVMGSGTCEAFVNDTPVKTYKEDGGFGELALLYNAPRAATVKAMTNVQLWALNRETFRNIVIVSNRDKREEYEKFLLEVPLLKTIDQNERSAIADVLEPQYIEPGVKIIKEGEAGDYFYILVEGEAKAETTAQAGKVRTYKKADYFGELALLSNKPRQATITAVTRCKVVSIDRDSFSRLLGNMNELLGRNKEEYDKWMK